MVFGGGFVGCLIVWWFVGDGYYVVFYECGGLDGE